MKDIQDLCEHIIAEPAAEQHDGVEMYDDCLDILIPYKLFGRALGAEWVEYAHGPLLFKCSGAYTKHGTRVKSSGPYRGPFMTWKSPSFDTAFMSNQSAVEA